MLDVCITTATASVLFWISMAEDEHDDGSSKFVNDVKRSDDDSSKSDGKQSNEVSVYTKAVLHDGGVGSAERPAPHAAGSLDSFQGMCLQHAIALVQSGVSFPVACGSRAKVVGDTVEVDPPSIATRLPFVLTQQLALSGACNMTAAASTSSGVAVGGGRGQMDRMVRTIMVSKVEVQMPREGKEQKTPVRTPFLLPQKRRWRQTSRIFLPQKFRRLRLVQSYMGELLASLWCL